MFDKFELLVMHNLLIESLATVYQDRVDKGYSDTEIKAQLHGLYELLTKLNGMLSE
jgi:hypothetical protein